MVFLIKNLLLILVVISTTFVYAEDGLRFSYWDDAKPPFVVEKGGFVDSGIIKDIADEISQALGASASFVKLPVARIEQQLKTGSVDIDCLTSPIWKESPGEYNWSPVLLHGADRFLVRAEFSSKLNALSDLKGNVLGIYNGYVYHPEIMQMIETGEISTIKVKGLDHGIQLLKLNRLDALIDFGILLKYQIREKDLSRQFVLAELPADEYKLHCAYSKKMKMPVDRINTIFYQLIDDGQIDRILKRYH